MSRQWQTIEVVDDGPVCWVRFDRPEHRNALAPGMVEEVHAALVELSARDDCAVVVVTGNGPTFCPGADVRRAGAEPDVEPVLPPIEAYQSSTLLREMPQLTVAAINGACAGAGMAWAAACDLRVAARRARFATALFSLGLASELGMVWTLRHDLGAAAAKELLLFPRRLDADELARVGFLQRVYDDETFGTDVDALVAGLLASGPAAIRAMKANLVDAARLGMREYVEAESRRHQAFFVGETGQATRSRLASRAAEVGTEAARPG